MRLFLSQATLEEWAVADKADVREQRCSSTRTPLGFRWKTRSTWPAWSAGSDEQKLLHKVKTTPNSTRSRPSGWRTRCWSGESAYDVQRGYLVQLPDEEFAAALKPTPDTDLLAQFLLDKL